MIQDTFIHPYFLVPVYYAVSYLAGSVNVSIVATQALKLPDPRKNGSGNAGATNLLRTAGPKLAIPVLLLDFGKAFLVLWGASLLLPSPWWVGAVFPLLAGNIWPVFHRFKGGKGVAAVVGAHLAVSPWIVLSGGSVFLMTLAITRRVSLSSLLMICSYPIWYYLFGLPFQVVVLGLLLIPMVMWTHRHNIGRLLRGQEPPITFRGRGASK